MADSIDSIIGSADWYKAQQAAAATQRSNTVNEASLGMQDFLVLLVAQLQNQDMMNPMDNTEFIAQMATFSQLTAINNMAAQSMTSYAVSLLGKEVTAAVIDPVTNKLITVEGVVTGISLFENEPKIYIGDKSFSLQSVMTVGKLPKTEETKPAEPAEKPKAEVPGGTDPDIAPVANPGGKVEKGENGAYIEKDADGKLLGEWNWDEDAGKWSFKEYLPESGGGSDD